MGSGQSLRSQTSGAKFNTDAVTVEMRSWLRSADRSAKHRIPKTGPQNFKVHSPSEAPTREGTASCPELVVKDVEKVYIS